MDLSARRTFAIISHPDAGKTTLTEKILFFSGSIQLAGAIKAKKASRHAVSDWMKMEQERGISVTTSVMQFEHENYTYNLLDTPGHHDFSEDTYRTLTAVDSGLMVIDAAKGVEERTKKLIDVVTMRQYPVVTFVNKLDRESKDPLALIDEIESSLGIACAPVTLPIGSGKNFLGVYHLYQDMVERFDKNSKENNKFIQGIESIECKELLGSFYNEFKELVDIVKALGHQIDSARCQAGEQTAVFFGSAVNNFGIQALLNGLKIYAAPPSSYKAKQRIVQADESFVTGFIFKIQANMDPKHRDRMAFMRIVSGRFKQGMSLKQSRTGKVVKMSQVHRFMAGKRTAVEEALPGDIVGIYNHGQIQVGDTFSEKESLDFLGIPHFAPELFRRVRLLDPMRNKQLQKGLNQLSEEGAIQVFRVDATGDILIGAVGALQFDVVAYRLTLEYGVQCHFDGAPYSMARWVEGDKETIKAFINHHATSVAIDCNDCPVFLATSIVNLSLVEKRNPEVRFLESKEIVSL